MSKSAALWLSVLVAVLVLFLAGSSSAFSLRELLGLEPAKAEEKEATKNAPEGGSQDWARPSGDPDAGRTVDLREVQRVIANLNPEQRQALLGDEETFRRFVHREADNLSVLAAAKANRVQEDPNTQFLMQKAAENILRESYLGRLIASKIPEGFPTEQQARDYYDKNKAQFTIGERVHVWQIFLPVPSDGDKKAADKVTDQAAAIVKDLNAGKISFADAAARYSTHEPSRHNGGYMGLVRVSELKPEISKPLMALAEGKVSSPIRTDEGVHILRRGAIVPQQEVAYEQVKDRIRELLVKQAQVQLRKAVYEQARTSYPVDLKDAKIEEWRLRLKTNLEGEKKK